MRRPLEIVKLDSSEDEGTQVELDRLATADAIAVDIIIEGGAFPATCEGWARMEQAAHRLGGSDKGARREWCYYIGMAVGIRLARLKADPPRPVDPQANHREGC